MSENQTSAPGRVCLFGEHQDYLGLPVIPAAINMRTTITSRKNEDVSSTITINAKDLGKNFAINLNEPFSTKDKDAAYFKAVIEVFKRNGHEAELVPFDCDVTSQIPIKSGLSSSAALLVAWTGVIAATAGLALDPQQAGWYAYEAEHDVMGIPCGMMDQLSSAVGNIIHLTCSTPPIIRPVNTVIEGLVVADTKIHKSTADVHTKRVTETRAGLQHLAELIPFDLATTPFERIEPYIGQLDDIERSRLIAVFKNRDITVQAARLLDARPVDPAPIGALLSEHQMYLREYFEVSIEKIDAIIAGAIKQGALGGKLTGAGLGGSIVILAPGKEREVAKAIEDLDGIPHVVQVDRGVESHAIHS